MKSKKSKNQDKPNLRARSKYSAVQPHLNLKTRYEEIVDILSYFNDLPEKDKEWMNKFVAEYVGASFQKGQGKRNLHKGKENKKKCYDKNNSRNRDILTKAKAQGISVSLDSLNGHDEAADPMDNAVNEIDRKHIIKAWDEED
jgi:hypothetical protein